MKKININEFLYFIGYITTILPNFLYKVTMFNNFLKPITYVGVAILFFLFILNNIRAKKLSNKRFFGLIIIFVLSLISSIKSGTNDMVKMFLIIFSFPYKDYDKFMKHEVILKMILIFSVVIFYFLGMTSDQLFFRDGKMRYAFGFSQPNQLALYITMLVTEILYLFRNNKKKIIPFISSLIGLIIVYLFADSRSSLFLLIFVILIFLYRKKALKIQIDKKMILKFLKYSFVIFTFISILAAILYSQSNSIIMKFNELFSSRIKWANVYYNYYGLNMFGHDLFIPYNYVKFNGVVFYCLDNAYVYFLLHFGLVFLIFYALLFSKTLDRYIKEKNMFLVLIFIGLFIYGLMENTILKYAYNPFLILLGFRLFDNSTNGDILEVQDGKI